MNKIWAIILLPLLLFYNIVSTTITSNWPDQTCDQLPIAQKQACNCDAMTDIPKIEFKQKHSCCCSSPKKDVADTPVFMAGAKQVPFFLASELSFSTFLFSSKKVLPLDYALIYRSSDNLIIFNFDFNSPPIYQKNCSLRI